MRLPRNLRMLRGPVDSSALAGTVFLLWTLTLLHSSLVFPPGLRMHLPDAEGVWGDVIPQLSLSVDRSGRLFFEKQIVSESNLVMQLAERTARLGTNQTLLVMMDRSVPTETLARLATVARGAGIRDVVLATSPRPGPAAAGQGAPSASTVAR